MTSKATEAVPETSNAPEADPIWAKHIIGGREITFDRPTPEQMMVLRRLARQLDDTSDVSRTIIALAKILDAVSACMRSDQERDFVDQLVLDRKVGIDELAPLITAAMQGPNAGKPEAPKNGPARRVRRR